MYLFPYSQSHYSHTRTHTHTHLRARALHVYKITILLYFAVNNMHRHMNIYLYIYICIYIHLYSGSWKTLTSSLTIVRWNFGTACTVLFLLNTFEGVRTHRRVKRETKWEMLHECFAMTKNKSSETEHHDCILLPLSSYLIDTWSRRCFFKV